MALSPKAQLTNKAGIELGGQDLNGSIGSMREGNMTQQILKSAKKLESIDDSVVAAERTRNETSALAENIREGEMQN